MMKAVSIKWATDGDRELLKTLPKEIKLPKRLTWESGKMCV